MENQKVIATKEQHEVFNEIMSKITETKIDDRYQDYVFYMVGDFIYIEQDTKNNNFYIRYSNFWKFFESKFKLNFEEVSDLFCLMLEEYFKCNINTIKIFGNYHSSLMEDRLKCKTN